MYLRKSCEVHRFKRLFCTSNLLAQTYVFKNERMRFEDFDSSLKHTRPKHSNFLHSSTKLNVFIFSKMKFFTSQGLHSQNDSEKTKKSTQTEEDNKKQQAGDKNAKPENKSLNAAKHKKTITNTKTKRFNFVRTRKTKIIALILAIASVYYWFHLVDDPITDRRKFHLFSENQTKEFGKLQSDLYKKKHKDRIETSGANYDRVSKVVTTLLQANSDLTEVSGERSWTIFIIDKKESVNSVVLANGDIFVNSGLLEAVDNDDHLAAVIAHGIAHVLSNHSAETPTLQRALLSMILHPLITIYGAFPGFAVAPITPFLRRLSFTTLNRPMGQKLEREADKLSIVLVSKACYDPRKTKEFWMAMEGMRKKRKVELLRAHPNDKSRHHDFDSLMPKAFNLINKHCAGNLHPYFR